MVESLFKEISDCLEGGEEVKLTWGVQHAQTSLNDLAAIRRLEEEITLGPAG